MITEICGVSEKSLRRAEQIIKEGGAVAFHTETVYGLGADARSDAAVRNVFDLKGRPADNPLIVHIHADYDLSRLIDGEPSYAEKLRKAFLPGPLTMVYPSKGKVSSLVSCGLNTLAVRVPQSETAQAFLRAVDLPIAAPSANRSKHVSPVTAQHVLEEFGGDIPLILDGGEANGGIESTVLDCTGSVPQILRAGLVTQEMIAKVVGACEVYKRQEGERPKSPGMAYKHYAPRTDTAYFTTDGLKDAVALYRKEEERGGTPYFLCETGAVGKGFRTLDLGATSEEMARRLYALLHEGERRATLLIAIEPKLRGGVMDGVLNRLTRAFGRNE